MLFVAQSLLIRYKIHEANLNITGIRRKKPSKHPDRCRFFASFGPRNPKTSQSGTLNETLSTAMMVPNRFVNPLTAITASFSSFISYHDFKGVSS
jgi:hypothetical protein